MDGLQLEIVGQPGHRHARIGTVEAFRVHGGRAYEMNDQGPPIAGNEHTPNRWSDRCRAVGLISSEMLTATDR